MIMDNDVEEKNVIKHEATPGFAYVYYASMAITVTYLIIVIFFNNGHH